MIQDATLTALAWRAGSWRVRSCQARQGTRTQARPRMRTARGCLRPRRPALSWMAPAEAEACLELSARQVMAARRSLSQARRRDAAALARGARDGADAGLGGRPGLGRE